MGLVRSATQPDCCAFRISTSAQSSFSTRLGSPSFGRSNLLRNRLPRLTSAGRGNMPKFAQAEFPFLDWGGRRRGAGRKPSGPRARVDHRPRPCFRTERPVHITLRLARGLPSLRQRGPHDAVRRTLWEGAERFGLRVVHYVVLPNHIHLLAEARNSRALSRGVRSLAIRVALALNSHWKRNGRVFEHRFHARTITTPLEAKNAIAYVLLNARRHGIHVPDIDPFSSAAWFEGWANSPALACTTSWLPKPRTWLLVDGWRQHGKLDPRHRPRRWGSPSQT